jgi:hypothetical protein
MGQALRNALVGGLGPLLAVATAGIASADPLTVVRGSDVSVVEAGDGDSSEEPDVVAPAGPQEAVGEPSSPLRTEPADGAARVFVVDVEASPETAWELVSPWEERGIETHADDGTKPSKVVTHGGPTAPEHSEIRVHGTDGERSDPSAIRTLPLGGDEVNIKVHDGRSQGPSRIRVHGVGSPNP